MGPCNPTDESKFYSLFELQSEAYEEGEDVVENVQIGDAVLDSQTVTFIDNEGGVCVEAPTSDNSVALVDHTDDLSLGTFLARPTLIDTTTWSTSDILQVKTTLKPWYLFLNNTLIKKKIDNYAFLRGQLHIKIVVNGTPFQYGCLRASYSPLLGFVADKITTASPFNPTLIPYSQQPGFYIYPQANAGGEMVLPFFLHKNWLDITSAAEVQNMGTLNYVIYAPLGVAVTGGSTSVTLRTYAWMTDVHLMGSTTSLALQAGTKDEYGKGPVSAPASAIASVASMLSKVPVIGKFARATEIGAGAVSSIATLFGFTNVPVVDNVMPYQPMNGPMLASAHIGTPVQKLTLDPKQELSIDPSPHGIGSIDELSLSYLKTKESYFAATSWATTDTPGSQLFNFRVNPFQPTSQAVVNASAATVGRQTYHIPLSYVGAMFKEWRGDIILRVKVVCTKFHKGRLKISYDPRADISIVDAPENAVYTQILDIGEEDDVEFRIPYHQALAWCNINQTITSENWTPGNALAPRLNVDNGLLTIRVLTALTAPASGSINLLFFLKGGDNFEYANPTGHIGSDGVNVNPSFFALQADDKTNVITKTYTIGTETQTLPERYGQNFGECVGSLRNVLHRHTLCDVSRMPASSGYEIATIRKVLKRMPQPSGYVPGSFFTANKIVAASGTAPYAYVPMSHLSYVSGMYLGYRGSVNYVITPSTDTYGFLDDISASRDTGQAGVDAESRYLQFYDGVQAGASVNRASQRLNATAIVAAANGLGGSAITSNRTNASLTINFPDYNNYNFSLVDPPSYLLGTSKDGTDQQSVQVRLLYKNSVAATPDLNTTVATYVGAGPDWTNLYFLCCPTLWYSTSFPTPV